MTRPAPAPPLARHAFVLRRLTLAAALVSGSGACGAAPGAAPRPQPLETPQPARPGVSSPSAAETAGFARSSNAFGLDLYRRVRVKPGNLILSPASISIALTMTWGGARGETAEQMRRVLHFEGTVDDLRATAGHLALALQDPERPVTFRIANQLFAEKTYELQREFVEKTRSAFGAPLELLDFRQAPEASRSIINRWVEEKTEERIEDLVPPGGITADTRLALVNAIYFLGDWEEPFAREATRPAPFHLSALESIDVPTMHRQGRFGIVHREGLTALELPYARSGAAGLSMVVLVPDAVDGLEALEAALEAGKLEELLAALTLDEVRLALPRLEVSPGASLALAEDLRQMGMPLAFDPARADFRGIADPPDAADRPVIGEVFHKGFVKVDEKGTEAAAATAVIMQRAGAALAPAPVRELKVDHPFLLLIRDQSSGLILFLGRVTDPRAG